MRLRGPFVLALPSAVCALLPSVALAEHPPDPFAAEYQLPVEREVGTAAGQFRVSAGGAIGLSRHGMSLGGQATSELMTFAYLGLRGTLQGDLLHATNDPGVWAAKVGPSLHLLPYKVIDLGLFAEGGIALVDPPEDRTALVPIVSPGATFEIWLDSAWFVRGEGRVDWAVYDAGPAARGYLRAAAGCGIGFAL